MMFTLDRIKNTSEYKFTFRDDKQLNNSKTLRGGIDLPPPRSHFVSLINEVRNP